jgi:hypothetical protein
MTETPLRRDLRLTRGDLWSLISPEVSIASALPPGITLQSAGAVLWSTIKRSLNDPDPGLSQINSSDIGGAQALGPFKLQALHARRVTGRFPLANLWYDITLDVPPNRSFVLVWGRIECDGDIAGFGIPDAATGAVNVTLPLPTLVASGAIATLGQVAALLPLPSLAFAGDLIPSLIPVASKLLLQWETRLGGQTLNGTLISALPDSSGRGLHATQPDSTKQPSWDTTQVGIAALPFITLARNVDWLANTDISEPAGRFSVFTIARQPGGNPIGYVSRIDNGTNQGVESTCADPTKYQNGATDQSGNSFGVAVTSPARDSYWHLHEQHHYVTGWRIAIDGVETTPNLVDADPSTGIERVAIGIVQAALSSGDFACKLIFNLLTPSEITIVRDYLRSYYGGEVSSATGVWCWFQNPRALRYGNHTWMGVNDHRAENAFIQYDHTTGVATRSVVDWPFQIDDHDSPTLLVRDSDKRLLSFWCEHVGTSMYMRISTNPEDATAWGARVDLNSQIGDGGYTYPCPFQLTGEVGAPIYLFYRGDIVHGVTNGFYYTKSLDDGATWSARTLAITAISGRPYFQVKQKTSTRIDFLASTDHPAEAANVSIYHFYFEGGVFHKTDGTVIGAGPIYVTDGSLVFDGTGIGSWCWDIGWDASGNPIGAFVSFPSTTDHRYHYCRWTGSAWLQWQIVAAGTHLPDTVSRPAPHYSGGITLDGPDAVYCSREVGGTWEIYRYVSADQGATWTMQQQLTSGSGSTINMRPVVPWGGAHADIPVVWCVGTYTDWSTFRMRIRTIDGAILKEGIILP